MFLITLFQLSDLDSFEESAVYLHQLTIVLEFSLFVPFSDCWFGMLLKLTRRLLIWFTLLSLWEEFSRMKID